MKYLLNMCFSMLSNQHLHVTEVELDTRVDTSVFPGRVGVAMEAMEGGWEGGPSGGGPNCSVGSGGQKVGKGTTACFAGRLLCTRNFPPCQGCPVIFPALQEKKTARNTIFATHHSTSIHIWSLAFYTIFLKYILWYINTILYQHSQY